MKLINEPIKVLAIFNKDGSVEPVRFVYKDTAVRIQKITKTYEQKILGSINLFFVCLHNGKDIYELKYVLHENIWYMYKA